jgi:3-phenylpropionate/trans-cinnamate dioxygenase ferredoxin reductase subunit
MTAQSELTRADDQAGRGALIVGASQAGVQLAVSLREGGYTDPITLVGAEPHLPYQRPPLSKKLFTDAADTAGLVLRNAAFYEERGIGLVLGRSVLAVDRDAHGGRAELSDGSALSFQHLALTVGAQPRRLPLPGSDLAGVVHLRGVDDALELWGHLAGARDVVVVGGGFVGLETAAAARTRGHRVTVVEAADRVMARAVSTVLSDFFLAAHRRRGVDVLLDTGVTSLVADERGRVRAVALSDGRVLPADVVVVGIGVEPHTQLAHAMGLSCDGGIVVDESCRTSDGVTVAAGDCTSMPNPVPGRTGRCRIESVNNAVEQAKNAAATLVGNPQPYRIIPWFWSDQADLKLQMVGEADICDDLVLRGDATTEAFTVLHYRADALTGAQCVNRPVDFMAVRNALSRGLTIPAAHAADAGVPLKQLTVEKALAGAS